MADERMDEELKQEAADQEETAEENACDTAAETEDTAAGTQDGDGSREEAADGDGKEKKGFFSKKKKEDPMKAQISELQDKVMRQMAEFENFRKRSEKEKAAMFETGARSVIEKILPVVDNFERGLAMVSEEEKEAPVAEGMMKIYKQLVKELENLGVTPIDAVGKEFDPNFHNAVMQVANDELEPGTVAQELLKGYMYRDTVVRHSMVAVVQE